ncbi:MAG TPA: GNAT family N-acetyltransferase [Thermoanaerobaculia bacterium]
MIRTAWPHDLPALQAFLARANDAPYDLAAVTEEKCFSHGVSGSPVTRVIEDAGVIVGAAVSCGRWLRLLAVARERRREGLGRQLLRDAEEHGVAVVAAEAGNYFTPGVDMSDTGTCEFFTANRYIQTRWTYNLDADLGSIRESPATSGEITLRRPRHHEADRVLEFVDREFGRIWRFEAARAFGRDVPPLFISEEDGRITGFAAHDVNNRGLGFFGPTGVTIEMRGRGIGRALLLASLADLRDMGYRRVVIPWTDLLEFYRRACGAEPAHRFVAFAKQQP